MTAILDNKDWSSPSVFQPAALLREARRQKGLAVEPVPEICVLDPDGDILRRLCNTGEARRLESWACYHTELYTFALAGGRAGIVGCAVGAPFAVQIAEELFACGCRHLLSITSAGQITARQPPPYFVIIDRALRDEGTSYHYAPPTDFAAADPRLIAEVAQALRDGGMPVLTGASWTTDATFRETAESI
jgi:uridine phosphorylase